MVARLGAAVGELLAIELLSLLDQREHWTLILFRAIEKKEIRSLAMYIHAKC